MNIQDELQNTIVILDGETLPKGSLVGVTFFPEENGARSQMFLTLSDKRTVEVRGELTEWENGILTAVSRYANVV